MQGTMLGGRWRGQGRVWIKKGHVHHGDTVVEGQRRKGRDSHACAHTLTLRLISLHGGRMLDLSAHRDLVNVYDWFSGPSPPGWHMIHFRP